MKKLIRLGQREALFEAGISTSTATLAVATIILVVATLTRITSF